MVVAPSVGAEVRDPRTPPCREPGWPNGWLGTLAALAFVLLAPAPLHAQQDTTVSVEERDRVRVWSPRHELSGREFDFRGWRADSIVLLGLETGDVTTLPWTDVRRLQVRTSEGSHLWTGALAGSGVGLITAAVLGGILCGEGGDYQGGLSCALKYGLLIFSRVTVPAGAFLGGLVGWSVPDHHWIGVDLGPATTPISTGGRTDPGVSVRVELRVP